ncbi:hypothetical protein INR49_027327, partial [Caranx melampygus]
MGAVRSRYKPRGLVSAHSSSWFVLGCITAPLLPRFSRGNTTAQDASPPSCCSVLSVFSPGYHGSRVLIQDQLSLTRRVDEPVVKPVVSVSPGKDRRWRLSEEFSPANEEQLVFTESGRSAAILLINQPQDATYKYRCSVKHELGTVEAQPLQEVPAPAAPCPPERASARLAALHQADLLPLDPLQPQCRVKLLCLLYTVLIRESTAVQQTLDYQHCVEQTEQLHPALRLERIQGKHCNRKGVDKKSLGAELPGVPMLSLEDRELLELEPLEQKRS